MNNGITKRHYKLSFCEHECDYWFKNHLSRTSINYILIIIPWENGSQNFPVVKKFGGFKQRGNGVNDCLMVVWCFICTKLLPQLRRGSLGRLRCNSWPTNINRTTVIIG